MQNFTTDQEEMQTKWINKNYQEIERRERNNGLL